MAHPAIFFLVPAFAVFLVTIPAFALEKNGVIEMPYSDNSPVIDGAWTSKNEWSDASQTVVKTQNAEMYLLVKHDRDNLYMLIDSVKSIEPFGCIYIYFDTNNDGASKPQQDDFGYGLCRFPNQDRSTPFGFVVGNPGNNDVLWNNISPPRGFEEDVTLTSINDPFESGRDHLVFESSIPLTFLHKQDKYGFLAVLSANLPDGKYTGPVAGWPESWKDKYGAADIPPSSYGTLIDSKSQVTVPPIPVISVSTKSLSFGDKEVSGKTSPQTVTITNIGTGILKIDSIRGSNEFSVSNVNIPVDVSPNQSIKFDVIMAPITVGEKSGLITISSNDLTNPSYTVSVEGKGIEKGKPLGSGCLIATAAFGSELAPQIQLLREVRDNVLFSTDSGTAFMTGFNEFYYTFSPTIADWERQSPLFKEAVKTTITPMLSTMSILNYANIHSEQQILGYGIGVILLNVGMYFVVPAMIILKLKSRIR